MGRLHLFVLVVLLISGAFASAGAEIDRDDGGRSLLGVPKDSTSTLEIGQLTGRARLPLESHEAQGLSVS